MWELIKYFNQLDGLAKMSQGGLLRKAEKYYFIAQCAVAHKEDSIPSNHDYITLADGTILSDNFGVDNFFDAVEKFNAFYAGEYEIVTVKEDGKEDLYYLKKCSKDHDNYAKYLTALRTKPFMLLAGISGTGKSRIVRELAFKSCTTTLHDQDGTTPGNYCMIEVKPNWHDSTELLGYYSYISKQYQFTKFVKFLVKAKMYPHVPFFVCLDEMNLAPVEQYFAEFLSILETRKKTDNGIMAGLLVPAEYFRALPNAEKGDGYIAKGFDPKVTSVPGDIFYGHDLITNGLTLPDNVFIIGTVNMDDTTHQFSRKVIDRAMTIEMNGGNLMDMFGGSKALEYAPYGEEWPLSQFQPKYVTADEVLEAHPEVAQQIQKDLPEKLDGINEALKGTPFQVSYRVLNEMVIYLGVLLEDGMDYAEAVSQAVDQIMLMKILPRIEGDRDLLTIGQDQSRLAMLEPYAYTKTTKDKLKEMQERLDSQEFTRFWP